MNLNLKTAVAKSQIKEDAIPKRKEETANDSEPQTVQRVHKMYEALGREDVKEAQAWDKTKQDKKDKQDT